MTASLRGGELAVHVQGTSTLTWVWLLRCRKRLRNMPELEREMELEKREEQKEKVRFRQMLSRRDAPKEKKKAEAARPKRKAAVRKPAAAPAVLDDGDDDDADDGDYDDDDFGSGEEVCAAEHLHVCARRPEHKWERCMDSHVHTLVNNARKASSWGASEWCAACLADCNQPGKSGMRSNVAEREAATQGVRRSSRQKTVGEKATKLDALASMRANRERAADASASAGDSDEGLTAAQRERVAARRRGTVVSSSSGSDSEGEDVARRDAGAAGGVSDGEAASDLSADEGGDEAPQEDVMRMQACCRLNAGMLVSVCRAYPPVCSCSVFAPG